MGEKEEEEEEEGGPYEEQLLGSPDGEGAEAHYAEVQQHEEGSPAGSGSPRVHPSIPEDESQSDGSDQGGYEVDQNEEGVALHLPHEAS